MKKANWLLCRGKAGGRATPVATRIHQGLAILVAIGFLLFPLPSSASGMMGVARVAGTVERNGIPLLNGGIVSSGDLLSTHAQSALQLSLTPQGRIWLGPETSARLTRRAGNVVIALQRGTVGFDSRGHVRVTIDGHELALLSRASSPVRAQLAFRNRRQAQVWLQKGSLEIDQDGKSVVLRAEPSGLIASAGAEVPVRQPASFPSGQQATSKNGTVKGTVVGAKMYVVPNATVLLVSSTGFTYTTTTNTSGSFTFNNIPPGSYTVRALQGGHLLYEEPNVVVKSGQVTSVYFELKGSQPKTGMKNKRLIIGVIAGAGAAVGIGLWAGLSGGHKKTTVSPSSIP